MRRGGPRWSLSGAWWHRIVSLVVVGALAGLLFGAVSCSSRSGGDALEAASTSTPDSLSPIMQAYYEAHPTPVDGGLRPISRSETEIAADVRVGLTPDQPVWLPSYLPEGFSLAAPYNGTGSGSAQPNPHVLDASYSITYTDGEGYVMVVVNSEDDLSQGEWVTLSETVNGRPLLMQERADMTLVATLEGGEPRFLVAGAGFGGSRLPAELARVAASLSVVGTDAMTE